MKKFSILSLASVTALILSAAGCCCRKTCVTKPQPCYTTTVTNECDRVPVTTTTTTCVEPSTTQAASYENSDYQDNLMDFESADDFEETYNK